MVKNKENVPAKAVESLFNKVSNLIEQARVRVAAATNVAEVYTKYQIGRYIVNMGWVVLLEYPKFHAKLEPLSGPHAHQECRRAALLRN